MSASLYPLAASWKVPVFHYNYLYEYSKYSQQATCTWKPGGVTSRVKIHNRMLALDGNYENIIQNTLAITPGFPGAYGLSRVLEPGAETGMRYNCMCIEKRPGFD